MPHTESFYRNRRFVITIGVMSTVLLAMMIRGMLATPQLGEDEDLFATVDALFTAVNSRDDKRLDDCERRLKSLRTDGKLPNAAAKNLDSFIAQARSGKWQSSAHGLYDFMLAQKRSP